jgi:hypothetical protein
LHLPLNLACPRLPCCGHVFVCGWLPVRPCCWLWRIIVAAVAIVVEIIQPQFLPKLDHASFHLSLCPLLSLDLLEGLIEVPATCGKAFRLRCQPGLDRCDVGLNFLVWINPRPARRNPLMLKKMVAILFVLYGVNRQ